MATDIYLLGSGIRGTLHLTTETLQAVEACRCLFVLHPDQMVLDDLRRRCPDVRDLSAVYDRYDVRRDVYVEMSRLVVAEAQRGGPVGFMVHGHPLFLVSAAEYTLTLATSRGMTTEILAGVSSFDTLLCDLGIDYGYGVQIFDSTTLLDNDWTPNPKVPLLVFQLATTRNPNVVTGRPTGACLQPLVDHLIGTYGGDHMVKVVHSAAFLIEKTEIIELPLSAVSVDSLDLERRPTLYVPALP